MTDFRNVKLKVLSREHSAAFQEAAFSAGARWWMGGDMVKHTDAKYLFTSNNDEPVVTCSDSDVEFSAAKKRLVSFVTPAYQMTKIRIHNPEHSEFVQKKLFENGCSWVGGITETKHTYERFLTIGGMGEIRFCSEEFFNGQKHLAEIFIEDDSMDDLTSLPSHMAICPQCGNKRCPKASNFEYKCTGTNDIVHTNTREITFNSKTHEIEFINNSIKNIDLGSLSQQMGYDIRETETSDGTTASYYELPDGATELQHLISHKDMNSQIGEIFRSCYRYGQASHSDKLRDAKKIQFYINAEIERLEKLNAN